jgi:tetratricopeptide (TPR) repeat protein
VAAEPGVGGWKSHVLLARVYEELEELSAAYRQLELADQDAPAQHRFSIRREMIRLAHAGGDYPGMLTSIVAATAVCPDDVEAHAALFLRRVDAFRGLVTLPTDGKFDDFDAAVAYGDWQAGYEAALQIPLATYAGLSRLLYLADTLRTRKAPDAALDLLSRALDAYPANAPIYWALIQVLTDLERVDDALAATEILRALPGAEALPVAA